MKVLVVHDQNTELPSGEAIVAQEEVKSLRASGVDVRLHTVSGKPLEAMSHIEKGWTAANLLWSVPSARRIGRLVDEFRPDVVHFHSILPRLTPSAFWACQRRGVPVVQTLHNFRWLCIEGGLYRRGAYCDDCIQHTALSGLYHRCARESVPLSALLTFMNATYVRTGLLFRLVDGFVAVSNFVRDLYVRKGFPAERVHVKYNSVSVPEGVRVDGHRDGIAYAGRLHGAKGTAHLKRIMGALRDVTFNVMGDGPDAEGLRDFVEKLGLRKVAFLGRVAPEAVQAVFSSAECIVVPSVFGETLSRVALEAMSVGTPVVGSRIGGLGELLEGNAGAVAVDPANSEEFVTAIGGIIGNREKVATMGAAGREFVRQKASTDDSVKALVAIYEQVIARKGAGGG